LDRISEIIDRAISIANKVKMKEPDRFERAQEALRKIATELRSHMPDHPALQKLDNYLNKTAV